MTSRLRLNEDTLSGLLFVVLGGLGFWISRGLSTGSVDVMGPGYLPRVLCGGLILLGIAIAARGADNGLPVGQWHIRSLVFVLASILLFGLLLPVLGLFVTACFTVVVAALASRESRFREVVILALSLAAGSVVLFFWALGLPMRPWPL